MNIGALSWLWSLVPLAGTAWLSGPFQGASYPLSHSSAYDDSVPAHVMDEPAALAAA
jgi:hypothetical protein